MPSTSTPLLTVVFMLYNEALSVESVVRAFHRALSEKNLSFEILIVDDGSSDGSTEIAQRLQSESPEIRVISFPVNRGLGMVYYTGFSEAKGEYISFLPADGQFPVEALNALLPHMPQYEMILGYISGEGRPWQHQILSKVENLTYQITFGGMPRFQGILLLKRSMVPLQRLISRERGWVIIYEIILRLRDLKAKTISVETVCIPRSHGSSKVTSFKRIFQNIKQICILRWNYSMGEVHNDR